MNPTLLNTIHNLKSLCESMKKKGGFDWQFLENEIKHLERAHKEILEAAQVLGVDFFEKLGVAPTHVPPQIMLWRIGFKDPDGCGEFAYWADEDKRLDLETALEADGESIEKASELLYEDPKAASKKFFEHGEYGNVELKLQQDGTGTCRLMPRSE